MSERIGGRVTSATLPLQSPLQLMAVPASAIARLRLLLMRRTLGGSRCELVSPVTCYLPS